jgi:hypothetical protein
MSTTSDDYRAAPDVVADAREFIRGEGNCVVSIWWLLDELSDKFGDRFPVPRDTYELLDLIETLWVDPQIDQVPGTGVIEFAWNEKGHWDDEAPSPFVQELSRRLERRGIGSVTTRLLGTEG